MSYMWFCGLSKIFWTFKEPREPRNGSKHIGKHSFNASNTPLSNAFWVKTVLHIHPEIYAHVYMSLCSSDELSSSSPFLLLLTVTPAMGGGVNLEVGGGKISNLLDDLQSSILVVWWRSKYVSGSFWVGKTPQNTFRALWAKPQIFGRSEAPPWR